MECGSKRKGDVGLMFTDTEEGKEKHLKVDGEVNSLSVILALHSGSAEVARQPYREQ